MQLENVDEQVQDEPVSFLDRILGGEPLPMRWEIAAYVLLIVIAASLRFWDLGSRALHHDESLHATYSWYLAVGRGYRHDPMMHGPLQFHLTALVYFLLGASDYVSRVMPALFGTALVGLPWLLRHHLGKAGALATAGLLTISPVFLYYSRFARNDIYMAVWTLLMAVFMWRYLEGRRPRDLYYLAAALVLSFAQKETAFIGFVVFGSFLLLLFLSDIAARGRLPGDPPGIGSGAGKLLIVGGTLVLPLWIGGLKLIERLPGVQLPAPTDPSAVTLYGSIFVVVLGICSFIGNWWDGHHWPRLAILFWAIYVVLYTTFLSNIAGMGTGVVGSLTYWLDQHDVKRGDQPVYYYFVLLTIYEFLPIALGIAAVVYYRFRRSLFVNFLVYWAVAAMIIYSIAGEKMPWLSLHIALPLILLGGKVIGKLLGSVPWRRLKPQFYFSMTLSIVLLFFLGATVMTWGSRGGFEALSARQELMGVAIFFALFLALEVWLLRSLGGRLALKALAVTGLIVLLAITVRTSVRASFQNGDTPVEMVVYTQSSPELSALYREIEQLSVWKTGSKDLAVWVDGTSGFSWPWAWYLRDYKNASYPDLTNPGAPPAADVVIVHSGNVDKMRPLLTDYTEGKRYRHRWWFPEALYRDLTPQKFLAGLVNGNSWTQWGKYFLNRELPESLGSEDGYVFFRRDLPYRP